jgi:hypothetical protein
MFCVYKLRPFFLFLHLRRVRSLSESFAFDLGYIKQFMLAKEVSNFKGE